MVKIIQIALVLCVVSAALCAPADEKPKGSAVGDAVPQNGPARHAQPIPLTQPLQPEKKTRAARDSPPKPTPHLAVDPPKPAQIPQQPRPLPKH